MTITIKLEHDKVNLVFSTDQHLSANPIGRRSDNYQEAVLDKLRFQGQVAEKLKGVCLSGGDLFHHKKPRAIGNTVGLLEATARVFRDYPQGMMFGTIGNHDLSWDRMDSLPDQPLGVLIAAGVYHNLVGSPVLFTNRDASVRVLVETFPYCSEIDLLPLLLASGPKPVDVDYRVALLHAYGHPNHTDATWGDSGIGYNPIGYDQLADLDYDFMCWGHDHSRKGVNTVGNVTHVQLGSLARAAYNIDEIDRPVSLAVLSFSQEGMRFVEKEIPVKPIEAIFTTADKPIDKVAKTEEVTDLFDEMDEAIDSIESNDAVEVLTALCPNEEPALLSLAIEVCEF